MTGKEVRRIREDLNMSREDLMALLCMSTYNSIMNIETDYRNPGKLVIRLLRYIDSLPKTKAKLFIEEFKRHDSK